MKPLLFALALCAAAQTSAAPAWPQFRGPNATGVAPDAKPPGKFGPEQNVLWMIDLPFSPSSPVVWGDHILVTTFDEGKLQVRDYRRSDGENRWARGISAPVYEDYHAQDGSPAASSPATDGKVVVAYFGSVGLVCHDLEGNELWTQPMPPAEMSGGFGSGTSPIIVENKVILMRDHQGNSAIMAFDVSSGKKLWQTARPESKSSYGTPVIWAKDGRMEVIAAGSHLMHAYDLNKGGEKWRLRGMPAFNCTTPAVTAEMIYFAGWAPGKSDFPWPAWSSTAEKSDKNKDGKITPDEYGDEASWFKTQDHDNDGAITEKDWRMITESLARGENALLAIKPGGAGNVTATHVAWKVERGLPYIASALYYDERVYMVKDGGMVSCFNAKTGEAIYAQERIDATGSYYASPVAADGRVFFASLNGKVTILKAAADKPEILHQVEFKEKIAATPALVGTNVYIRTKTKLYAFGEK